MSLFKKMSLNSIPYDNMRRERDVMCVVFYEVLKSAWSDIW